MKKVTGYTIYQGPSRLDGKPIVVILLLGSDNVKTGNMMQTYILRSDIAPLDAVKTGEDSSICGNCPHRGIVDPDTGEVIQRSCYVNIGQGPRQVYEAYKRGNYPRLSPVHPTIRDAVRGRVVRLGTYGDPAAAPVGFWDALLGGSQGWTGYTHQWRTSPHLRHLCMASADCPSDQRLASEMGWRTFRVRLDSQELQPTEIICPASNEGGKRVTCDRCQLCQGASKQAKSIAIILHGSAAHIQRGKKLLPVLQRVRG
jgi:hypothetical protein